MHLQSSLWQQSPRHCNTRCLDCLLRAWLYFFLSVSWKVSNAIEVLLWTNNASSFAVLPPFLSLLNYAGEGRSSTNYCALPYCIMESMNDLFKKNPWEQASARCLHKVPWELNLARQVHRGWTALQSLISCLFGCHNHLISPWELLLSIRKNKTSQLL